MPRNAKQKNIFLNICDQLRWLSFLIFLVCVCHIKLIQHSYRGAFCIEAEFVDEFLNVCSQLLLCFVFALLERVLFAHALDVVVIVAFVLLEALRVQVDYVRRAGVEEFAIVRHDKNRALPVLKMILEPISA